jgi:hypothetical protein
MATSSRLQALGSEEMDGSSTPMSLPKIMNQKNRKTKPQSSAGESEQAHFHIQFLVGAVQCWQPQAPTKNSVHVRAGPSAWDVELQFNQFLVGAVQRWQPQAPTKNSVHVRAGGAAIQLILR